MIRHVGEWHTVMVRSLDKSGVVLDSDVEHLESCEVNTVDIDEGFTWNQHVCDMARELDAAGFDAFDITDPGTYRARCIGWEIPANPISGGPEWDTAVEVERIPDPIDDGPAACPYYRHLRDGGPAAKCTTGCHWEPHCIVDEPYGGWRARNVRTGRYVSRKAVTA
jgi:hypothetical protein